MRMMINLDKSCFVLNNCSEAESNSFLNIILTQMKGLEEGFKYLGFYLKPDRYRKKDWGWLIRKVEARISSWVNRTLSRGGHLVLLKSMLESIPVYWNSIVAIPKGILDKLRRISCRYLWAGHNSTGGVHLASWSSIVVPKNLGGWGLKDIHPFARALAGRNLWLPLARELPLVKSSSLKIFF
jgi:hypothetical protein